MKKSLSLFAAYLIATSFAAQPVSAATATTDWIDGNKLKRFMKSLPREKNFPVGIKCKEGPGRAGTQKSTLFKVTTKENVKEIYWNWAWGNSVDYKFRNRNIVKDGYKAVSTDSYKRSTGQTITCAVYHHETKRNT